jgi:hypothetical protein
MANCKTCGEAYPQKRRDMGYTVCVTCSTEPGWSCSALTFHKTGNSIEIIKDPELAYNINQMASRKSFGVMSGITGRYSRYRPDTDTQPTKRKIIDKTGEVYDVKKKSMGTLSGQTVDFDAQGNKAIDIVESEGLESAITWLKNEYRNLRLSQPDFVRLVQMIRILES